MTNDSLADSEATLERGRRAAKTLLVVNAAFDEVIDDLGNSPLRQNPEILEIDAVIDFHAVFLAGKYGQLGFC